MSNITGKWQNEWETKRAFFEAQTGKKAPSKGFMANLSRGLSVTSAFGKMDKAYAVMGKNQPARKRMQSQDAFEKTIEAAKKAADSYVKVLDKAIEKEVTDAGQVPIKKTVKPLLKILKDDIDLCITSAEGMLEASRGLNDDHGGVDPRKFKDLKQFTSRLPGSIKQGLMWIKVLEQKPEVDDFNEGIVKATRDVAQNLNNIRLLLDPRSHEARTAKQFLDILEPWHNQGKKLDAKKDTFAEVLKESRIIKRVFTAVFKWQKGMKAESMIDDLV